MRRLSLSRFAFLACTVAALSPLVACSGSSVDLRSPTPPVVATQIPTATTATAVFTLTIAKPVATISRARSILTSAAQSVTIVVTPPVPGVRTTASIVAGAPNCVDGPSTRVCTIAVAAAVGTDTFVLTVYDGPNGTGNIIATATVQQTVATGTTATAVPISLGGVATSVTLALGDPYPPAGIPKTIPLLVSAKDASGNIIVGPYANPIVLSSSDAGSPVSPALISDSTTPIALSYSGKPTTAFSVVASGAASASTQLTPTSSVTRFALSMHPATPFRMTAGPDGALYFGELGPLGNFAFGLVTGTNPAKIGRIDASGAISEVSLPGALSPADLIFTPDGALWVAAQYGITSNLSQITAGELARFAPGNFSAGGLREISIPAAPTAFGGGPAIANAIAPRSLAIGSDGMLYVGSTSNPVLLRQPVGGPYDGSALAAANFASQPASGRFPSLTNGPDGNLWATDRGAVHRIGLDGVAYATFAEPVTSSVGRSIVAASDGNLYTTALDVLSPIGAGYLYRLSTSGVYTPIAMPTALDDPDHLALGGAGIVYFSDLGAGAIGRVLVATGAVQVWPATTIGGSPQSVAVVPDGTIWFTGSDDAVGRVILAQGWSVFPSGALSVNGTGAANALLIGIAESGESGPFTVTSANPTIAAIAQPPGNGTAAAATFPHNFLITGGAPGTTTVKVVDARGRTQFIPVTVTTTSGTIQSRGHSTAGI